MNTDIGVTSAVLYGKLAASKTFGSYVAATQYGAYNLSMSVKSGGSFSSADLPGTWHVCEISRGTFENVYYGTLDVASGGAFTTPKGSGTASIDNNGTFTGTISLTSGGHSNL